jgi:hypothetical protein
MTCSLYRSAAIIFIRLYGSEEVMVEEEDKMIEMNTIKIEHNRSVIG